MSHVAARIHITDNAIIPLKERMVTEYYDPVAWAARKVTGKDRGRKKVDRIQDVEPWRKETL